MSYRMCPQCNSSNRSNDRVCYNCQAPLEETASRQGPDFLVGSPGDTLEAIAEVAFGDNDNRSIWR